MTLIEALGLRGTEKICIIGCGGKTSLMLHIANAFRQRRVLLSTTTHIRLPDSCFYDHLITDSTALPAALPAGVNLLGQIEPSTGKLMSIPLDSLSRWSGMSDLTLLEGDGSRGLPLKGWSEFEPVIPDWTTVTLGVVTTWTVGRPVHGDIVFRQPLFCALTSTSEGQPITVQHIADMVAAKDGMFKNAVGRRILLINQVENQESSDIAARLAESLHDASLDAIVAGSVKCQTGTVLSQTL
jgi:probable selenium-dependent hydroxylase accessory protein YqeC